MRAALVQSGMDTIRKTNEDWRQEASSMRIVLVLAVLIAVVPVWSLGVDGYVEARYDGEIGAWAGLDVWPLLWLRLSVEAKVVLPPD